MSNILDSLRRAVDQFPGGRAVVAVRMGKTDEVLRKELSGATTHKLGAVDALSIAALCLDAGVETAQDYASVVATECRGRFEPLSGDADRAQSPVQRVSELMRETSDVTTTVIDAMQDGVVSDNELARIENEINQAELVLQRLRTAARAVNANGKPREHLVLAVRRQEAA